MKILSALALFVLVPAAAFADARQDLVDGMAKCAAVADNTQRLSCYDALNPALKAAQTESSPPAATVTPAPAQPPADTRAWYDPSRLFGVSPQNQTSPEQFGSEHLAPPVPKPGEPPAPTPIDSITATVTDYSYNPFGHFLVVLDNGQIWRQLAADTGHALFDKHAKNMVTVSRGYLGSYNLTINDSVKVYKVERLK